MKKLVAFISALIFCIIFLAGIKVYFVKKVNSMYYDEFGTITVSEKSKNIALENLAINRQDTLFILGSSELKNSKDYSVNPSNFFAKRKTGFQVYFNGQAGFQTLVHAIEVAAVDNNMKDQKVVFILSPQWFDADGIDQDTFEANSSQLQAFEALSNSALSTETKTKLAKRMLAVMSSKDTTTFTSLKKYCELIVKDDTLSRAKLKLLAPYFWIQHELLTIRDSVIAYGLLKESNNYPSSYEPLNTKIDWDKELQQAENMAINTSTNNPYGMDDKAFNEKFKDKLKELENSASEKSYSTSPEYEDLKLLLDIFNEKGIEPLIVSVPCNGLWYDYIGFNNNDINNYFENIRQIVGSYKLHLADFSGHEYDKYFLKDATHLGWKGWVYVNEAIDEYYRKDKK